MMQDPQGWIGVDLDGTLARYDKHSDPGVIGQLIEPMAERIRYWLDLGIEVRIMTARADSSPDVINTIRRWTFKHFGQALAVTNRKDFMMLQLWDDRVVQVIPNTGIPITDAWAVRCQQLLSEVDLVEELRSLANECQLTWTDNTGDLHACDPYTGLCLTCTENQPHVLTLVRELAGHLGVDA